MALALGARVMSWVWQQKKQTAVRGSMVLAAALVFASCLRASVALAALSVGTVDCENCQELQASPAEALGVYDQVSGFAPAFGSFDLHRGLVPSQAPWVFPSLMGLSGGATPSRYPSWMDRVDPKALPPGLSSWGMGPAPSYDLGGWAGFGVPGIWQSPSMDPGFWFFPPVRSQEGGSSRAASAVFGGEMI